MVFQFNIDMVLNKHLHPSIIGSLPQPLKRFLGGNPLPPQRADYWLWLDIFLGSFCGIALLEGLFKSSNVFTDHHNAPMIIASYGATAILCFNAIAAPLAQPRNILVGHFVSSLIGICISKLFSLSTHGQDNYWAAGALSVALASVAMTILNCVHPPAGASALLPCVDETIRSMSWWYLPTHLVSSVLIICVSLITNNILRKYPIFWWTPANLAQPSASKIEEQTISGQNSVIVNDSVSPDSKETKLVDIVNELNNENKSPLFTVIEDDSFGRALTISANSISVPYTQLLTKDDLLLLALIHHRLFDNRQLQDHKV